MTTFKQFLAQRLVPAELKPKNLQALRRTLETDARLPEGYLTVQRQLRSEPGTFISVTWSTTARSAREETDHLLKVAVDAFAKHGFDAQLDGVEHSNPVRGEAIVDVVFEVTPKGK